MNLKLAFGVINVLVLLLQTAVFYLINSDFNPLEQSAVSTFKSAEELPKYVFKFAVPMVFLSEVRAS